jgi:O-antigen/teichoic acid export membrane protein
MRINDIIPASSALKAVGVLWAAQLAAAGIAFLTQPLLTRTLSLEQYGAFAAALASVNLLAPLAGFGIGAFWLRLFGKEGWSARRWITSTTLLVALSSVVVMIGVLIWAWSGVFSTTIRTLMTILTVTVLGQVTVNIGVAIFQLEGRYLRLAICLFLPHAFRLIVAVLTFLLAWSAFGVAAGYTIASVVLIIVYSPSLWRMLQGKIVLLGHGPKEDHSYMSPISHPSLGDAFHGAWPFAFSGLFYLIYFQSSIALLGVLADEEAAAVYNIAFLVMSAVYLFPNAIYQQYLMPHLHRWAEHDKVQFLRVYSTGGSRMLIYSLVFMGVVVGLSPWIVPSLFGEEYRTTVSILSILSLCIPLRFLATHVGSVLVTGENMRRKVRYQSAAAVLNVALNIGLIPLWGVTGAAVATVSTEFFLLMVYLFGVKRHVFGRAALNAIGPVPVWLSMIVWLGVIALLAGTQGERSILTSMLILTASVITTAGLGWKYSRSNYSAN